MSLSTDCFLLLAPVSLKGSWVWGLFFRPISHIFGMCMYSISAFGQSNSVVLGEESVLKNKVQFPLYKLPSSGVDIHYSPAVAAR